MDKTRVLPGNDVGWNTGTTDEVVARHDWGGRDTLAVTVVTATAQLRGVDAIDLPLLSEAIDPDALCQLFDPLVRAPATDGDTRGSVAPSRGHIEFRYAACDVTLWADGTVIVTSA
ncbi:MULTISPECIES: HalOD1 output domain-containing protein [Haloferax]|uniref:Halobacterial output domain-containing protein n=1 Tax=Haloferax massiliensis TaxID=1476858 RepID=A0A0D6JLU4_9EURY|nr:MULTISPECIES: HalOD1 output domain-containing protein [Haloferax]MDS0242971.1 hypothetical protein [Haloferax sp. S2CR25]MDS0446092.1 hypothetical protein [Haloferax sp. S2CR25-2]CQR48856.1 hypothetical protein BN996_00305 [Haloferax massiliensis]